MRWPGMMPVSLDKLQTRNLRFLPDTAMVSVLGRRFAASASTDRIPAKGRIWFTSRLSEAEKAQYRDHDHHRPNEPNDIVHNFAPVAWGSSLLFCGGSGPISLCGWSSAGIKT